MMRGKIDSSQQTRHQQCDNAEGYTGPLAENLRQSYPEVDHFYFRFWMTDLRFDENGKIQNLTSLLVSLFLGFDRWIKILIGSCLDSFHHR